MKFKFMLPAMALVVLAGCAKEQAAPEAKAPVSAKDRITFTSSTSDATKVALNADNSLYWIAGDQIAVYNYKSTTLVRSDVALITSGEGTSVATFTPNTYPDKSSWYVDGDGDSQAYVFSAFYPGSSATPSDQVVSLSSVSASQTESAGIGSYIIGWATANTTKATLVGGTAPSFAFAPKTALLKLALKNNSSTNAVIEYLTITADNGNIAGTASLDLSDGSLTGGSVSTITYKPTEPIKLLAGATTEASIPVSLLPNSTLTKLTLNFSLTDCTTPSLDIAISNLESGHVYSKLAVLTTINSTKKAIETPDPGSKTLATSSVLENNDGGNALYYGTANCVVIASSAPSATINIALYESADGFTRSGTTSSEYATAVAEAKIIWAEPGLYNDANFKISAATSTNITIAKTAGTSGNALIGIYDQNGDLLWSYHLWVPEDATDVDFGSSIGGYSGAKKLALGQITGETDTYIWYQWGRKDPLGRANSTSNTNGSQYFTMYGTAPSVDNQIVRNATGCDTYNTSYARQNPWMFITDNNQYDWYPAANGSNNQTKSQRLWSGTSATINDPCPLGYHVPSNATIWAGATGKDGENYGDLVKDGEDNIIGLSKNNLYYVLGGYRGPTSSSVRNVGSRGRYWSATVRDANSAYNLNFNASGTVSPQDNYYRAHGVGVRCVKNYSD